MYVCVCYIYIYIERERESRADNAGVSRPTRSGPLPGSGSQLRDDPCMRLQT